MAEGKCRGAISGRFGESGGEHQVSLLERPLWLLNGENWGVGGGRGHKEVLPCGETCHHPVREAGSLEVVAPLGGERQPGGAPRGGGPGGWDPVAEESGGASWILRNLCRWVSASPSAPAMGMVTPRAWLIPVPCLPCLHFPGRDPGLSAMSVTDRGPSSRTSLGPHGTPSPSAAWEGKNCGGAPLDSYAVLGSAPAVSREQICSPALGSART